jgi:hypothetical protein
MQILITTPIDEQTAAAVVAAVALVLAERRPAMSMPPRSAWATAGIYAGQGLPAARGAAGWSAADRIGRAGRWTGGVPDSFQDW